LGLDSALPPLGGAFRRDDTGPSFGVMDEAEIYATIGEAGFERLIAAFYRQVPGDDILGPMYPSDDLAGAEQRLRDFLVGRFGGPQRYVERRGHPRLRARHMPFAIDERASRRWLELMDRALADAALPPEAAETLREFFAAVAAMMINRR
jgi:hemoglobin